MEMGYMYNSFPGFGIFFQLILFILFIGIIYWVVKSGNIVSENPEEILKKRLAKGEINKKEYESILKEISK